MSLPNNLQKAKSVRRGFTVVEMLVVFTLFSVVISVSVSMFLNASRTFRLISGYLESQSSLRFIMESMTREIKEGTGYQAQENNFTFTNKDGGLVSYYVGSDKTFYRSGDGSAVAFTGSRLSVEQFDIFLSCAGGGSCQPSVTFVLRIVPKTEAQSFSRFSTALQTTITQRKLAM